MKTFIVIMLVAVLAALAGAGAFMLKNGRSGGGRSRMANALALRVALSVALFLVILLGWYMGWIRPGGLPIGS